MDEDLMARARSRISALKHQLGNLKLELAYLEKCLTEVEANPGEETEQDLRNALDDP